MTLIFLKYLRLRVDGWMDEWMDGWMDGSKFCSPNFVGERGGSVVECRTPEREVRGSRPTSAVLCP